MNFTIVHCPLTVDIYPVLCDNTHVLEGTTEEIIMNKLTILQDDKIVAEFVASNTGIELAVGALVYKYDFEQPASYSRIQVAFAEGEWTDGFVTIKASLNR